MEACRGNNTDLLQEIIAECKEQGKDEKEIATLINSAKNAIGNYGYHEAALRGNCKTSILGHIRTKKPWLTATRR
jgi:hypothetical protein